MILSPNRRHNYSESIWSWRRATATPLMDVSARRHTSMFPLLYIHPSLRSSAKRLLHTAHIYRIAFIFKSASTPKCVHISEWWARMYSLLSEIFRGLQSALFCRNSHAGGILRLFLKTLFLHASLTNLRGCILCIYLNYSSPKANTMILGDAFQALGTQVRRFVCIHFIAFICFSW